MLVCLQVKNLRGVLKMKHIIEEFEVYTFDELPEEIQDKIIEREQYIENRLDYDWWVDVEEVYYNKYKNLGIDDAKLEFNLSYGQGDYARVVDGTIDLDKILKNVSFKHNSRQIFIDYLENYMTNGTVTLEWFFDYNHSYPRLTEYFQEIATKVETELNEKIEKLNREFYHALDAEYMKLNSEEYIREELLDSDILYYKDGRIYSY